MSETPEEKIPPDANSHFDHSADSNQENPATSASSPHSPPVSETDASPGPSTSHSGTDPLILRRALNILAVVLLAIAGVLAWQRIGIGQGMGAPEAESSENTLATPGGDQSADLAQLAPFSPDLSQLDEGISRRISVRTIIPNRPRSEVLTYTVQQGDNLFKIADLYGLQPETILWGNYETLKDNPQMLSPDQVLNILPEDGTYYQWQEGDTVQNVAAFFQVEPQAILEFPGNQIDLTQELSGTYGIEPGTWLIVKGGKRELKDWGPPAISRSNPASAAYYGAGHCGSVYEGAVGVGTFVWPTTERFISGYHYSAIHRGIDIGGSIGNAVFATDSGVVVYSGWSNYGYGNLIVVDHGTGWQSAYAHLNTLAVTCGQSVGQGTFIGGLGSTGNSSGPHLHFELTFNGAKPNPLDFLP